MNFGGHENLLAAQSWMNNKPFIRIANYLSKTPPQGGFQFNDIENSQENSNPHLYSSKD